MQDGRPYNDISLLETADDLYTADDNAAPACLPSKGFLTLLKSLTVTSGRCRILNNMIYSRYKYS